MTLRRMRKWLTSMAAREGVGLKREQLTTTASTSVGAHPASASASSTAPNMTSSASLRARSMEGTGGVACMASGRYVSSPMPPFATIFS